MKMSNESLLGRPWIMWGDKGKKYAKESTERAETRYKTNVCGKIRNIRNVSVW
jgi:hypothetical protein